ncbi:MAG: PqqD family peptide modification chaperone [Gemmatimonadota bacterium]
MHGSPVTQTQRAFALDIDAARVGRRYAAAGVPCSDTPLHDLASALAASPVWKDAGPVLLVVREDGPGRLGILGDFPPQLASSIQTMEWQIDFSLDRLRYVSYQQVEADCAILAAQLTERLGREELADCRFVAIPRGGWNVLGILSYMLDIQDHRQDPDSEQTVIAVDDCALSGLRCAEFLEQDTAERVVFAHLYSHPELRAAVENREPRVLACLGARDLVDHAPDDLGGKYEGWKSEWEARSDRRAYWAGHAEHICFPWNEPDVSVWNPASRSTEAGWRVVPPSACVKNRIRPNPNVSVQVQPPAAGELRPLPSTLFGELSGKVLVANVDSGECLELKGTAADMWNAILRHENVDQAVQSLCDLYAVRDSELRPDLNELIASLTSKGVLGPGQGAG